MPFCANCGANVEGRFCARCGATVGAPTDAPVAGPSPAGVPPAAAAGGLSENAAAALCYVLGLITGILFLVIAPYNQMRSVRFHAFQSIFLNVAWIAVVIGVNIVAAIMTSIMGLLGALFGLISLLAGLGFFVLYVFMIIKAYQGQKVVLPIIGPLAEKQA